MVAVNVLAEVIGLDPADAAIDHVHAQGAAAAAVDGAGAPDDFSFGRGFGA